MLKPPPSAPPATHNVRLVAETLEAHLQAGGDPVLVAGVVARPGAVPPHLLAGDEAGGGAVKRPVGGVGLLHHRQALAGRHRLEACVVRPRARRVRVAHRWGQATGAHPNPTLARIRRATRSAPARNPGPHMCMAEPGHGVLLGQGLKHLAAGAAKGLHPLWDARRKVLCRLPHLRALQEHP